MISSSTEPADDETTVPPSIRGLAEALTSAYHAFDDIDSMSMEHRVRVLIDLRGAVLDAAHAAARAGHAARVVEIVKATASVPPPWAEICNQWDALLSSCIDAAESGRFAPLSPLR